jgi:hypothetical protein
VSELAFDEATHTYRVGGLVVPSVTQVLRPLIDLSGIPPAVLEAKRDLGTRVHAACQFDAEGDLDEATVEDDVAPYLEAWRRFLAESDAVVLASERRVFNPLYRYAGTLDLELDMGSGPWIVDIKTSIATPLSTGPQTAAYLNARKGIANMRRAALRLRPDGTYRFDQLQDADDWSVFLSCLTLHRYRESHRDQ